MAKTAAYSPCPKSRPPAHSGAEPCVIVIPLSALSIGIQRYVNNLRNGTPIALKYGVIRL